MSDHLLMTMKDMAITFAGAAGIPQAQALQIVQRIFDGIIATLVREGRIELRNFGVFEVRQRKPRRARDPRTGNRWRCRPRPWTPSSRAG
jgi:nucleoid DNA-binding protein